MVYFLFCKKFTVTSVPVEVHTGDSPANPGASCEAIADSSAGTALADGPYWVQPETSAISLFCDMTVREECVRCVPSQYGVRC